MICFAATVELQENADLGTRDKQPFFGVPMSGEEGTALCCLLCT